MISSSYEMEIIIPNALNLNIITLCINHRLKQLSPTSVPTQVLLVQLSSTSSPMENASPISQLVSHKLVKNSDLSEKLSSVQNFQLVSSNQNDASKGFEELATR